MMKHGSIEFYRILDECSELHDRKSHDYANQNFPYGNYHFAGYLACLFAHSPEDAGFVGRIGEKIYRLANLESSGRKPKNESIEDTERDIVTIAALWMASRRESRANKRTADDYPTRSETVSTGCNQGVSESIGGRGEEDTNTTTGVTCPFCDSKEVESHLTFYGCLKCNHYWNKPLA